MCLQKVQISLLTLWCPLLSSLRITKWFNVTWKISLDLQTKVKCPKTTSKFNVLGSDLFVILIFKHMAEMKLDYSKNSGGSSSHPLRSLNVQQLLPSEILKGMIHLWKIVKLLTEFVCLLVFNILLTPPCRLLWMNKLLVTLCWFDGFFPSFNPPQQLICNRCCLYEVQRVQTFSSELFPG